MVGPAQRLTSCLGRRPAVTTQYQNTMQFKTHNLRSPHRLLFSSCFVYFVVLSVSFMDGDSWRATPQEERISALENESRYTERSVMRVLLLKRKRSPSFCHHCDNQYSRYPLSTTTLTFHHSSLITTDVITHMITLSSRC